MDQGTDDKFTDTVKQEKASAQQASRPCVPSWFCIFSLLALSFYSFRALSALAPRPMVLHAVPESELVAVSLTVNPELFTSAIKSTGKRVVFGKPSEPLQLPTDFLPPLSESQHQQWFSVGDDALVATGRADAPDPVAVALAADGQTLALGRPGPQGDVRVYDRAGGNGGTATWAQRGADVAGRFNWNTRR